MFINLNLPENWPFKSIKESCELIMGQSPPGSSYNEQGEGMPFLQGKAEFGDTFPNHVKYTTKPLRKTKKGTILMSVRAPVGDVNIANLDYCIGRGLASINLKNGENKYLFYLLNYLKEDIARSGTGSTFKAITKSTLEKIKIPIPPLKTQQKIVEILEKAEKLKKWRVEADVLTDEYLKSVFLEMFGTPEKNENKFRVVNLGDYADFQGGFAFKSKDFTSEGVKLVKITNVHFENLDWDDINYLPENYKYGYQEFLLKENDIVMAMTRPIIKSLNSVKVVMVNKDDLPCLLNQRVGRFIIRNNELNPFYLLFVCYSEYFMRKIDSFCSTSLQPNVSSKQVEKIQIILPPLELQNQFAETVKKVEQLKQHQKQSKQEIDNLFNTLMQKAFKGELTC